MNIFLKRRLINEVWHECEEHKTLATVKIDAMLAVERVIDTETKEDDRR